MISDCSRCSKLYDFPSLESANEPGRLCLDCWNADKAPRPDTPETVAEKAKLAKHIGGMFRRMFDQGT